MSLQCVPNWEIDDNSPNPCGHLPLPPSSSTLLSSMSDYEVAELKWRNGQLSTHGLVKPATKQYSIPADGGTLESIVSQAKLLLPTSAAACSWQPPRGPHGPIHHHNPGAVVPNPRRRQREDPPSGIGSCDAGEHCRGEGASKRARVVDPGVAAWDVDTSGTDDLGFGATGSVTLFPDDGGNWVSGSPETENTSFGGGGASRRSTPEHDSACHSRRSISQREMVGEEDDKLTEEATLRSTVSTKRSRAAAVHNQSERKRRDRINQKMRTLQKLVPNSSKTDKASMLEEVIEYLKQLQAQLSMMSRMNMMIPSPMSIQQQLQMSMMVQMAHMAQVAQMGMGMMDLSSMGRAAPPAIPLPVVTPPAAAAFMPVVGAVATASPWEAASGERMQQPGGVVVPDPFSGFVACPTPQPQVAMDAYQKMAAMYQQMLQQPQPANPR